MWLLLAKSLITQGPISKPLRNCHVSRVLNSCGTCLKSLTPQRTTNSQLLLPWHIRAPKQPHLTVRLLETSASSRTAKPAQQTCIVSATCVEENGASSHPAYISEESETETGNQVAANESGRSRTSWVRSAWGLPPRESCRSSGECP